MKDEDLLKCPLLQGLDAMHRAELLGFLNDSNLRERIEKCLEQHEGSESTASTDGEPRSFDQRVHSWNPKELVFSRSPKE